MKAKARVTRAKNAVKRKVGKEVSVLDILTYLKHMHDDFLMEVRAGEITKVSKRDALGLMAFAALRQRAG